MRYGIQFEDDHFDNYRSGWIVNKFKVEKINVDLYQVTEMYDNPEKYDLKVIFESLIEACIQNNVEFDSKCLAAMELKSLEM